MTVIGVKTVKLKFDIFFLLGKKHNSVTATWNPIIFFYSLTFFSIVLYFPICISLKSTTGICNVLNRILLNKILENLTIKQFYLFVCIFLFDSSFFCVHYAIYICVCVCIYMLISYLFSLTSIILAMPHIS
jgi:hypothetical protein